MLELLVLLVAGGFAGLVAGLLGVGGGIVLVPVLLFVFEQQAVDRSIVMHMALGTSLATIVVTSLSSIVAHQRKGAIVWPVVKRMTPGILVGALAGAGVADLLDSDTLKRMFAPFLVIVAYQLASKRTVDSSRELPGALGLTGVAGGVGALSSLFGIGGGSLNVPFLTWCGMPVRKAIASAAAMGFPIALAGAAGFVVSGWNSEVLPPQAFGYIHLTAFLSVVAASTVTAPLGAHLAHVVPETLIKKIFAVLLVALSLKMLFG